MNLREDRRFGEFLLRRFGDPEIDHLWHRAAVVVCDEDIGGFYVPVNNAFLMGVLNGLANLNKELQALADGQMALIATTGDRDAAHQRHHEIRPATFGRAGVQHLGDAGMVHQCQGLSLRLKTRHDLLGIHAEFDDLKGDAASYRLCLFGEVNGPEASFADLLQQSVASNDPWMSSVFKLNADGTGYTLLKSFSFSGGDGAVLNAGLLQGTDGALYGTTYVGGTDGNGTVFKLNADGSGYGVLHSFSGPDGVYPQAGLVQGSDGALYGTTGTGGSGNATVFKLNADGTDYTVLHSFSYSDGANPYAGVLLASDCTLYGTTSGGGSTTLGTVFRITRNPPPTVAIVNPGVGLVVPSGTAVNLLGTFADTADDVHTAQWMLDAIPVSATVNEGTQEISGSYTFITPGVYSVALTVTDGCGQSASASTIGDATVMVVVYDPSAGFVTGSGWFNSPEGAYAADALLAGKANFGFVSKYKKGAAVPTGETEFQFKVGHLKFNSSSYDWLVVSGARAQYKGTGTINGSGSYKFMLSAIDGQVNGAGGTDRFRIHGRRVRV